MLDNRKYLFWSSLVFLFAGSLHFLRIVLSWDLVINDWLVPVWVSGVSVVITWGLVLNSWARLKK